MKAVVQMLDKRGEPKPSYEMENVLQLLPLICLLALTPISPKRERGVVLASFFRGSGVVVGTAGLYGIHNTVTPSLPLPRSEEGSEFFETISLDNVIIKYFEEPVSRGELPADLSASIFGASLANAVDLFGGAEGSVLPPNVAVCADVGCGKQISDVVTEVEASAPEEVGASLIKSVTVNGTEEERFAEVRLTYAEEDEFFIELEDIVDVLEEVAEGAEDAIFL